MSAAPHAQDTTPADVAAPPERFNFAQHLLDVNAGRPDKVAFIDDQGQLTYGALAERTKRLAAGLPPATRVIPGHGAPGGLELIARQRDYLDALLAAVGRARAQGQTLEEIRDSLHLEAFRNHFMYDLVHAIH
ncbi:MAG TPA: hypothetical protein PK510_10140, partial [Ottowia sp.]|nr:hypothetical protein [Ottowia sp.]